MKNAKKLLNKLSKVLDRIDIVALLAFGFAIVWILLTVLNIMPPWLKDQLPVATFFLLSFIAMWLHRSISHIENALTTLGRADLIFGHDLVYEAAKTLVEESPRNARYWATSIWTSGRGPDETEAAKRYWKSLIERLKNENEAEYRRACFARSREDIQRQADRAKELLAAGQARIRFYAENPLAVDFLIGEREAIIALPDRRVFPLLRVAIRVRDPEMVTVLRQWYEEFIWDADVEKQDIRTAKDAEDLVEQWRSRLFPDQSQEGATAC